MSNEEWRPVPGFEGMYEVSNLGGIRSLTRRVPCKGGTRETKGRILSPVIGSNGRPQVTLLRQTWMVHPLVAGAFIGPRPVGMVICHNNGDMLDNRAVNLRYDTAAANVRDTLRHGRNVAKNRTHCPQGHPYDESNTLYNKSGHRRCRECHRLTEAARYQAKRAVA